MFNTDLNPKQIFYRLRFFAAVYMVLCTGCTSIAQDKKQMVRLAIIETDSGCVDRYNRFLAEEIGASIEKEPGVITLYAVAEKENPKHVTLLETYSDSSTYKLHLTTPHFQKYKQGTLQMVKHLELIEATPIIYNRKKEIAKARAEDLFIRLIKMEIDSSHIQNFYKLATDVMLPGIRGESGILVMYAVSEKAKPTHITVLEVYANGDAYQQHLKTPHFIQYKEQTKQMVTSLKLIDVTPILLGAKPQ
jgi:quinol monooxygenase YgiN